MEPEKIDIEIYRLTIIWGNTFSYGDLTNVITSRVQVMQCVIGARTVHGFVTDWLRAGINHLISRSWQNGSLVT